MAVRTGSLGGDAAAGSEAKRDQLQRHHERLREGWPVAARTGALGGDAAAGSETRRDQLQRRHERLREGGHKSTTCVLQRGRPLETYREEPHSHKSDNITLKRLLITGTAKV